MNYKGVSIRKIKKLKCGDGVQPSREELHKQMITLGKKMRKGDSTIEFEFAIEKDHRKGKHIHLLINHNDKDNLYNHLLRFIGGNQWSKQINDLTPLIHCEGEYGEVDIHDVYDVNGFRNYINKESLSETLW